MIDYYKIILYIIFGVVPSLAWLFYYLRKDLHPEPKQMILKVFLYGALSTIPAFFIQTWLAESLNMAEHLAALYSPEIFPYLPFVFSLVKWFVVVALVEETTKYLAMRLTVFKNAQMDEPMDIMLYMVVSALGFAALENILYLFSPLTSPLAFDQVVTLAITISFIRFIGATFLHTLCAALIGYFLAKASIKNQPHRWWVVKGVLIASLLHGLYNFSIINLPGSLKVLIPVAIIVGLSIFVIYDFDEIKKVKSICKLK